MPKKMRKKNMRRQWKIIRRSKRLETPKSKKLTIQNLKMLQKKKKRRKRKKRKKKRKLRKLKKRKMNGKK